MEMRRARELIEETHCWSRSRLDYRGLWEVLSAVVNSAVQCIASPIYQINRLTAEVFMYFGWSWGQTLQSVASCKSIWINSAHTSFARRALQHERRMIYAYLCTVLFLIRARASFDQSMHWISDWYWHDYFKQHFATLVKVHKMVKNRFYTRSV